MFKDWGGCVDPTTKVATLKCIPIVFSNLVAAALIFAGTVALIMMVWGAFMMVRSGGDAKQVAQARGIITWAIWGLLLVLLSFGIIYFISYITGVDCITQFSLDACK